MKFDFETSYDQERVDSIATEMILNRPLSIVKEGFDRIPMWVADMNFKALPTIQEEMIKRIKHPTFGYFNPSKEYFDSIINWHKLRNNTDVKEENIGYENSVLGGVVSALNVLASKGDNILIHSPTYIGFTHALENNGYHIIHSPLFKDKNNVWRMDYNDMEKKIIDNKIHVAIICSPHNPTGRVWEKEELVKAMEIYKKHNVWVISDEIWSDIILKGYKHTPTQSVNEYAKYHTVAEYAPSKTFNLAGLIGSYRIVYNKWLNDRIEKEASLSHYDSMNVLWMHALIGAYKPEGHIWTDELNETIANNVNFADEFIRNNFKGIKLSKPQGTYMLFIECEEYLKEKHIDLDALIDKGYEVGVIWQDGRPFHHPYAIRINLALPTSRVKEAFRRLKEYVFVD